MSTLMSTARIVTQQYLRIHHKASAITVGSSLQVSSHLSPAQNPLRSALFGMSYLKTYSTSISTSTTTRTTSTVPPESPQNEYLVIVPDHPDTSATRAKAKPGHVKAATPLIDAGVITYCGVILSAAAEEEERVINGSAIVMKAGSEKEVREFLGQDEYTKLGVWDVKQANIWRFRSG